MAEKVEKEHFLIKEVKAKVQVEPKTKKVAFDKVFDANSISEIENSDQYYVIVNRTVDAGFKDSTLELVSFPPQLSEKNTTLVVNHHVEITIVQGLKNQDNWVLKIDRKLTETTIFQGT